MKKAKNRTVKPTQCAVLRRAASDCERKKSGTTLNAMQQHIDARAGQWDGYCSGEELLRKTRP
jgi:hypothetical protein